MFCSSSISIHLLRGVGALGLVLLAVWWGQDWNLWLRAIALLGAVFLMRGCPMCWLLGLLDTLANRRARDVPGSPVDPGAS